ncbi:MAG: hypothetical protein M1830_006981, partial [Pleopsidium flavum]
MASSSAPTSESQKVTGDRLKGKVAIVTGGASGFGASTAQLFARESCKVLTTDINASLGSQIASTNPDSIHFVRADVTSSEDWKMVVDTAVRWWGRVDVLVNCAGGSYANK